MAGRKILGITFGLVLAGTSLYILFLPRFQNHWNCESSVPLNTAQAKGLEDARSRTANACSASRRRCKFGIVADPDGTFRVSLDFVDESFFEGCNLKGRHSEVFVYGREGQLLRMEEPPF